MAEVATHDVQEVTKKSAEGNAGYASASWRNWRKRCALRSHGEYASRRICIMSSSEGVWASLVFKQYNTQMDFMGREFLGWVGIGAAMSSRSSQHMVFRAIVACNMLHTLASIAAPHPIYSCLFLQLLISMCATP